MKKSQTLNGFTLIEMLVVISILSVVGVLILTIFTNTLKGSNKSQIIGIIKQNGQSVLENMDKTIRNSDDVVCPITDDLSKSLVVVKNGIYTRFRFIDPKPSPPPPVNGQIHQDNPAKGPATDEPGSPEETDQGFIRRVCEPTSISDTYTVLTDTNLQTGVSVSGGWFTRDRSEGYMDQVTIKFDVEPGEGALDSVSGQIDPVTFQTTIQLR